MPRRGEVRDPVAQAFGSAIRSRRESQELTLEDLAGKLHTLGGKMDPRYLGEIELGWHSPTIITAKRIADALGVPLANLVKELDT